MFSWIPSIFSSTEPKDVSSSDNLENLNQQELKEEKKLNQPVLLHLSMDITDKSKSKTNSS